MRVLRLAVVVALAGAGGVWGAAPGGGNNPPGKVPIELAGDEVLPPEIKTSLGEMPGPEGLPVRAEMPDVMVMNDGTKVTTAEQWGKRREEMKKILEYYAVGQAPPAPGNVKGVVEKEQLVGGGKYKYRLIKLTFGPEGKAEACALEFGLWTPVEGGAVGVVITQDGSAPGAASLPRLPQGVNQGKGQDVFSASLAPLPKEAPVASVPVAGGRGGARGGRGSDPEGALNSPVIKAGYAYVTFNSSDCAEDTTARMPDGTFAFRTTRFFPAYPGYDWGVLRAWAWGASRIVDYLVTDPAIDKTKIAITGVSRNGKSSLIAGAFDERFTLVAPVASSGGGTPAFRFSGFEHGGNEGLSEMVRKYPNWFSPHLHAFFHQQEKLPFDNHWYLALCAPRAVIALEGLQDQNVNKVGVRESFLAAEPAFKLLGAEGKLGVNWSTRPHGLVAGDWEGLFGFADKWWQGKAVERKFDDFPAEAVRGAATTR